MPSFYSCTVDLFGSFQTEITRLFFIQLVCLMYSEEGILCFFSSFLALLGYLQVTGTVVADMYMTVTV